MDRKVENLLRKAAHLRHSAAATYWVDYREKMLRVARDLEGRAARLEQELNEDAGILPQADHASKR